MRIAFGIIGTLLLIGGLIGLMGATSAVGQIQSSITVLVSAVLLVGAAILDELRQLRPPKS